MHLEHLECGMQPSSTPRRRPVRSSDPDYMTSRLRGSEVVAQARGLAPPCGTPPRLLRSWSFAAEGGHRLRGGTSMSGSLSKFLTFQYASHVCPLEVGEELPLLLFTELAFG